MFGGGDNEALGGISGMASSLLSPAETASGRGREERAPQNQPQWGHQETKDFIAIRAELEKDFKVAKRNKTLWEIVSSKMRERGYRRTPDQCKCKWKNLVNRYKASFSLSQMYNICVYKLRLLLIKKAFHTINKLEMDLNRVICLNKQRYANSMRMMTFFSVLLSSLSKLLSDQVSL